MDVEMSLDDVLELLQKGVDGDNAKGVLGLLKDILPAIIKEIKRLKKRDDRLSELEAAGVDNWEGY